jgi:hypothetical protein
MKELFDSFKRGDAQNSVLLDTCFILNLVENDRKLLPGYPYALTSFNVEELLAVSHRLHKVKARFRRFLKSHDFVIVDVPVHIGDMKGEKAYVESVDPELLKHIADPSDAVLLAAAVKSHSVVMTKDKHHLFTVELENYLRKYDLKVFKEMKDLKG